MKTISIIIPVYNVERYLKDCLVSIFVDNAFCGEVVCVNDGSTDNSGNILAQYAERYNNLKIITQSNGGLSKARNTGLAAATGDYVLFLDSDDRLTPDALRILSESISDEDIVYYNVRVFEEKTKSFEKQEYRKPACKIRGRDYYFSYPVEEPPFWSVCVWGGVFRRHFLLNNNLWNEDGLTYEDELFTPKSLYFAESLTVIPKSLYIYRKHADSITGKITPKNCNDHLYIANSLYTFFKEHQWLTDASKQSIWDNFYYAYSKSLLCKMHRRSLWRYKDGFRMLECSFTQRHRRTTILSFVSFHLAVAYYTYSMPRFVRKVVNLLIR